MQFPEEQLQKKKPQNTSREKIHEHMGQSAGLLISFSCRKGIKGSSTGTKTVLFDIPLQD